MNKRNITWILVILLLTATNAYSLYQNYTLKKGFRWQHELDVRKTNAQKLSHQNIPATGVYSPVQAGDGELIDNLKKNPYSLLVLFEPNQCGSCLNEKILWNSLYEKKQLPVYGVTYLKDRRELTQFLQQTAVKMPIYQDTSAIIGKWLLPNGVPVKLLVDKDLNVVLADYVRDSPEKREEFETLLTYFLQKN